VTTVPIPGDRSVTGTLDRPDGSGDSTESPDGVDACVVACPPHPQMGGSRSDRRLVAVADALRERGIACLRFDYGPWDGGRGERRDAGAALDWADDRYDSLGLFGYSFGGAVAVLVAADRPDLCGVAALAPAAELGDDSSGDPVDAGAALDRIAAPTLVVYGERDDTVDWERVVERARSAGHTVESVPADHHFVGQHRVVGERVGEFFEATLESA